MNEIPEKINYIEINPYITSPYLNERFYLGFVCAATLESKAQEAGIRFGYQLDI